MQINVWIKTCTGEIKSSSNFFSFKSKKANHALMFVPVAVSEAKLQINFNQPTPFSCVKKGLGQI